jgi:hypothetical protein
VRRTLQVVLILLVGLGTIVMGKALSNVTWTIPMRYIALVLFVLWSVVVALVGVWVYDRLTEGFGPRR